MGRLPRRLQSEYADVLFAIFDLMLRTGIESRTLERICGTTLKRAAARVHLTHSNETGGLMTAALVLDAWHRDHRYLTRSGAPKPVPLLGGAPSVEAMVRSQRPKRDPAQIARRLRRLGLVVPYGARLYRPASDVAVISEKNPLVLQHTVRALSALLETVGKNLNRPKGMLPLIERHAEVPNLPRKYVQAFQVFTQTQGRLFIRTVNDWLESRRVRQTRRPGDELQSVRAGVHTYAYFAPNKHSRFRS